MDPGDGYALPFPEANPWKKSNRYTLFTTVNQLTAKFKKIFKSPAGGSD